MSRPSELAPPEGHFRIGKRALLLVAGVLMTATGLALALLFIALLTREVLEHHLAGKSLAEAVLVAGAGALICGGFATMGATRILAGIRGYRAAPSPRLAGGDSWYRRNWYAVGFGFWALWVLGAVLLHGPEAVFLWTGRTAARLGWYAFLGYLLLPVHVALHELGHAVAGALLGFRFVSVRLGWLTVQRDGAGYRASWARPLFASALGLHTGLPDGSTMLRGRTVGWAAAGPVTSLLVAFVSRACAESLGGSGAGLFQAMAEQALWVAWWMGLVLAATSTFPFRTLAGFLTDGAIVYAALAPMSAPARLLFQFYVQWSQGRRPRDWGIPSSEFLAAAEAAGANRDALLLAAASVALDTGAENDAAAILARALAVPAPAPSPMRYELELQTAMVAAFQGRTAEARERLARAGPLADFPAYRRLADAVVDACDGATDAAAAGIDAWELAVERTGRASSIRVGNHWAIERLRLRLRSPTR